MLQSQNELVGGMVLARKDNKAVLAGRRGQVLSYDAIGGIVIFLVAVGILVTYWSSLSASFSDADAVMVIESNTALDNLMSQDILMENAYVLNKTKFVKCSFNPQEAGIFHEYYLQVIGADGKPIKAAGGKDGCGTMPASPSKIAVSERLAYISDGNTEYPVKVVLKVFVK
ncbi:MAG: hypothetical protein N3G76_02730 [Candidatus Micrarchaeota archaeon]|nr:hypothetical protein [Candidatus Micrarchaeota archaeon]